MTDREIAHEIGKLILKQRVRIAALTTELNYNLDSRWKENVRQSVSELSQAAQGAYEFSTLEQAIDNQDDCNSLLHILHQYISRGVVESEGLLRPKP